MYKYQHDFDLLPII